MSLRWAGVSVLVVLISVSRLSATGEAVSGFPRWEERVIQELMNRARVNPAIELAGCGLSCGAAEMSGCYNAVAPLVLNLPLSHSSRFHSDSMWKNAFFNHPTPFVVRSNIDSLYPAACDASASCAGLGTGTTDPSLRMSYFGGSGSGEIIAYGYSLPSSTFYLWLYENGNGSGCTFTQYNGHRYLILTGGPAVGVGYSAGNYWTGDFGGSGPIGKIPSGSHWGAAGSSAPNARQSSSVDFWANWYDSAGPLQANVIVDGAAHVMSLSRGTSSNGAWSTTLGSLGTGCHRYYFSFQDSRGQTVRYPTTGTLGVGPAGTCADWSGGLRGDFDGNSKSDIVLRDSLGSLGMWMMNGPSVVSGSFVGAPGGSYTIAGIADFDGNGKSDILLRDALGNLGMWFMDGASIVTGAFVGAPGGSYSVAGVGDFNGDGKADILLRDSAGNLGMWIMDGATITSGAFVGGPGGSYNVAGIGDFNGDGKTDILLRDSLGSLGMWIMNGPTITSGAFVGAPGGTYSVAGIGDFDGDGKTDILLRDSLGSLGMWIMNGATITSGAFVGAPGGSYTVAAVNDYNGDGKADIILRDSNGSIGMWIMNGATITSGALVGSPGPTYSEY